MLTSHCSLSSIVMISVSFFFLSIKSALRETCAVNFIKKIKNVWGSTCCTHTFLLLKRLTFYSVFWHVYVRWAVGWYALTFIGMWYHGVTVLISLPPDYFFLLKWLKYYMFFCYRLCQFLAVILFANSSEVFTLLIAK